MSKCCHKVQIDSAEWTCWKVLDHWIRMDRMKKLLEPISSWTFRAAPAVVCQGRTSLPYGWCTLLCGRTKFSYPRSHKTSSLYFECCQANENAILGPPVAPISALISEQEFYLETFIQTHTQKLNQTANVFSHHLPFSQARISCRLGTYIMKLFTLTILQSSFLTLELIQSKVLRSITPQTQGITCSCRMTGHYSQLHPVTMCHWQLRTSTRHSEFI